GYFTIGGAAVPGVDLVIPNSTLNVGPAAVAIYVGDAANFPNGPPVTTTSLIDAIVYDSNSSNNDPGLLVLLNSGQPQVHENPSPNSNSLQRCPNGSGGARNTNTYQRFLPSPDSFNLC